MTRTNEILTTHQVAEKLGVNPVTVTRWVKAGKLPAFKTAGGHRRIRLEDLERFLHDCGYYDRGSDGADSRANERVIVEGVKIMVVDDEADIVELIRRTIFDLGQNHIVETAHDGFMAGYTLRRFEPQVVFLDLKMDGVDGFQVCRLIKSDPATASCHVIAVTGFATEANREAVLAAGAAECLAKPIGPQDIRDALQRALRALPRCDFLCAPRPR